ncbi:MAG: hypothetical protein ACYC3X_10835 [Pirellulaceae bacterium]
MHRHRLVLAVVAFCGVSLLHLTARAAEDVLTIVPDDALAVVVVNRVGETQQKIETLGQQLQIPAVELLRQAQFSVQSQPHVDPQGAVAIAVFPNPAGERPLTVWFVPTSDYQAFVNQFQPEDAAAKITTITVGTSKFLVAPKGSYAVLTPSLNQQSLERILSATTNVAAATAALNDWRAENDLYTLAMPSGIKLVQQQALAGLALVKAQFTQQGDQGKAVVTGLEMYESLFQSLDKEATHCGIGVRLMKDGVHVVSRTLLAEGGVVLQAAKEIGPTGDDLLAGLPRGPFVMAGGGILPDAWMKRLMAVSVRMMKSYPGGGELTDEQAGKLAELSARSLKGVRSMAMVLGVGQAGSPLYGDTVMLIKVDNSQEYLDNYVRAMSEMSELGKASKSPLFSARVEKTPIDGEPGLKVTMNMAAILAAGQLQGAQLPDAKRLTGLMFGDQDELAIYFAAANPHTVVGAYVSQERLVSAIKSANQAEDQLPGDASVQRTMDMLPKGAQWVGLASPRGMLQFVSRTMQLVVPGLPLAIPEFPETSPLGFAMKLTPAGLETDLAIPTEVLQATAEVIHKVRGAQPAGVPAPAKVAPVAAPVLSPESR